MSPNDTDEPTDEQHPAAEADQSPPASPGADATAGDDPPRENAKEENAQELAAMVELLAEENRRLREEYARARQSRYRRTALGLAGIGLLAAIAAIVFPANRDVLFALAATGLFGGVLTVYLAPGQFVAAAVSERVYSALATNQAAIADELGLADDAVYLPSDGETPPPARLYIPRYPEWDQPADDAGPIIVDAESRGLLLEATGAALFQEFDRAMAGDLAAQPAALASQLADGLVEQFELARAAEPDVDAAGGRLTVTITDSALGDVDRFDHPIASFVAVGIAAGLGHPVHLDVVAGDDQADWLVTCRWGDATDAHNAGSTATTETDSAEAVTHSE